MTRQLSVVTAWYGLWRPEWLGPFLESCVDPGGVQHFAVAVDEAKVPASRELIRWAERRHVELGVVALNQQQTLFGRLLTAQANDLYHAARLDAWRQALHLLPTGQRFVAALPDTLVRRPLEQCFLEATPPYCSLALARVLQPNGHHKHDATVLAGQVTPLLDRYLEDWIRELLRLAPQRAQLVPQYGSLESAAWQVLQARAEESGGLVLGTLSAAWGQLARDPTVHTAPGLVSFANTLPVLEGGAPTLYAETWYRARQRSGLA